MTVIREDFRKQGERSFRENCPGVPENGQRASVWIPQSLTWSFIPHHTFEWTDAR